MDNISSGNRQRVIDKAQAEGFGSQMQYLLSKGFTTPSQNLKYLRKHDGDQESALNDLKSRKQGSCERKKKSMEDDYENPGIKQETRDDWDDLIKILFLDGNNLLFVDSTIRTLSLKKQLEKAEGCIVALAEEFAKLKKIKKVVVVFDDTRLCESGFQYDRSLVEIKKARPAFRTADDYLVSELPKLNQMDSTAFVTSDRELLERMTRAGAKNIIRSGKWFACLKSNLGMKYDDILKTICSNNFFTK